ncbi:single-stranded DNA-binding protein [Acidithiobacillus montserratensis]|uniref:Single-stranded DNA-binding protein n=1 Tax=Acidithiobacillus montserratensis TaxID=2729135 RepID=A0ACD5HJ74_9PROT|nr:single-stranded DNA-binding protein [Acidithiobacillus montserratensis]MBU2748636.1 single-stranded DNA-binding protein [Acidithiobacillus montserratensis]
MAGFNRITVLGNLGRDPEMRYMPDGTAIASMSLATSESYKDKNGEKHDRVEWHRISLFGKTAEIAGKYLKKGSQALVEGKLRTRKWTDKEGQERYTTEIVGDHLVLVGGRRDGAEGEGQTGSNQQHSGGGGGDMGAGDGFDDDIPF